MASGHQLFKIPRLESVPDEPIKRLLSFASMLALWHDGYMNDALSAPLSESLPIVQIEQLVSQLDEALQAAEHSVSLAPTDADARRTLANIQQEFGQTVQARASYNQLIQLRPKAADSYLQRAQFFQQQSDLENMRRDAQQALKLDPNNAQAKKLLSEM